MFQGPIFGWGAASATAAGVVTTGAQTIAGAKTFTGAMAIAQTASGTETPLTITVSDDAVGKLEVTNGSGANAVFLPTVKGTSAGVNPGLFVWGSAVTDTGTVGVVSNIAQISGGAVGTRPTFTWRNHSTTNMALSAIGGLLVSGGTTPSIAVAGPLSATGAGGTLAVAATSTFTGVSTHTAGLSLGARADLKSYTVATLPAVGVAGGLVYVSDAAGVPIVAFSTGTIWARCDTGLVVS